MSGETSGFDGLEAFRKTYFEECAELLDATYGYLAALENGDADQEIVHALFRAVHSIKGGGGAFGLKRLVGFAHGLETLMDMVRDGRVALGAETLRLLLRSADMLSDLVNGARVGNDLPAGTEDNLLHELITTAEAIQPAPAQGETTATTASQQRWHIRFIPRASLYASANEPLLIFRDLARLGPLSVRADVSRLPDLASFDPTQAYLSWELALEAATTRDRIADAFEFVADECDLTIEAAAASTPTLGESTEPVADAGPQIARPEANRNAHSIRIDVDKIDRLVNLIGELVINQAMLLQVGSTLPPDLCPGLTTGLESLSQHLRELQESVMAIRAQPVRSVFSRMPRLIREVCGQLGKSARLVISGEGTEIDKTVIEQLTDPLTHLLRNAVDHGIETPDQRAAAGKPPQGTILLSAEHRSGRIVIEIADDGDGIDRDRVVAKARQRGLVGPDATLSPEEIDDLIFMPGFSTAEAVSDISGRGVGLDVVRRNIHALGGRISVTSSAGLGSRFTLSLPLTLAILDGMAVAVGAETYIIPLTNIMESLRPRREALHPIVGRGHVLAIRGEYLPLLYLHRVFGIANAEEDACKGIVVIVESERSGRFGIVVDEMLGQQQVVVKSLEANFGAVDGTGGATILGNGRVALILDAARLLEMAGTNTTSLTYPQLQQSQAA
jgi:two-component system, chemotaxis family, sensor kinase CheA